MNKKQKETRAILPEISQKLMTDNIVFLGGHPNLVKKVAAKHKNWVYLAPESQRSESSIVKATERNPDTVIVYWSGHISHSLDTLIRKRTNAPIVYVTATNLRRLEAEIANGLCKIRATA